MLPNNPPVSWLPEPLGELALAQVAHAVQQKAPVRRFPEKALLPARPGLLHTVTAISFPTQVSCGHVIQV